MSSTGWDDPNIDWEGEDDPNDGTNIDSIRLFMTGH